MYVWCLVWGCFRLFTLLPRTTRFSRCPSQGSLYNCLHYFSVLFSTTTLRNTSIFLFIFPWKGRSLLVNSPFDEVKSYLCTTTSSLIPYPAYVGHRFTTLHPLSSSSSSHSTNGKNSKKHSHAKEKKLDTTPLYSLT